MLSLLQPRAAVTEQLHPTTEYSLAHNDSHNTISITSSVTPAGLLDHDPLLPT
jgi:hypothetical protein